jgi:ribonuclease BN (tRNA processing enzyme)
MKVTLWGTRGSLAAPGPETMRYGGNTSCVEVRGADGTQLILDSGTGIRRLGETIEPGGKRIDLLLTHLHMDHIQGLGFFDPLFEPGLEAHIWGPSSSTLDLGGRLARYLSPPLFPVYLCNLPCRLTLHDVVSLRRFRIGGLEIEADLVCHPGPTVGYRISEGDASFVYLRARRLGAQLDPARARVRRAHGCPAPRRLPPRPRALRHHPRPPVRRRPQLVRGLVPADGRRRGRELQARRRRLTSRGLTSATLCATDLLRLRDVDHL